jgi:hypothetical protein
MTQGRIDLAGQGSWYRYLVYQPIAPPITGFEPVDPQDLNRYSTETMLGQVALSVPDTIQAICARHFYEYADPVYSVQLMMPGQVLPLHTDTYARYQAHAGVTAEQIFRTIVFVEDWQSGHISEVDGRPICDWRRGDYVTWQGRTKHMAANLGHSPRYTLQITARKKQQ